MDDLPANLFALECILAPLGQRLVRAASGQEALRRVLDEDFAVILLDLRLGDMNGVDVLTLLRQRERNRRTPVLILSGMDGDAPELQPAFKQGAVDYMRKPLVPDVLRDRVSLFVELRQMQAALRRQEQQIGELSRRLDEAERELAVRRSASGTPVPHPERAE
ncbi:response regulator [Pyxidicoccus parkwayensis]|uniref:Response regulator n=1 Tax=Pyxidicoccus parkwayensis TaxID=2813578 RepID=A0ABX7P6M5_9BACT|nr:response regulator [Pyxidicoccus parkwaysis]QSQ26135.1 response regulator [Pyxidicoccus parkwaysis]